MINQANGFSFITIQDTRGDEVIVPVRSIDSVMYKKESDTTTINMLGTSCEVEGRTYFDTILSLLTLTGGLININEVQSYGQAITDIKNAMEVSIGGSHPIIPTLKDSNKTIERIERISTQVKKLEEAQLRAADSIIDSLDGQGKLFNPDDFGDPTIN